MSQSDEPSVPEYLGQQKLESPADFVTSAPVHVMSPDEAERYTLLWDAADEMSRANGQPPERNWLGLMDSFWSGDLASDGLTYFYPGSAAGREFFVYDRAALAGMLLGHGALDSGKKSIDDLRHWRVDDYRTQPDPFADFFQRDPEGRIGLAIPTHEFNRWRRETEGAEKSVTPNVISTEGEALPKCLRPAVNPMLRAAIEDALRTQGTPGKTAPWKKFCDYIRSTCQVTANTRGYGDRSIERAVRAIMAEQDKHDKSDMSHMS
jgi:hypothetical protein